MHFELTEILHGVYDQGLWSVNRMRSKSSINPCFTIIHIFLKNSRVTMSRSGVPAAGRVAVQRDYHLFEESGLVVLRSSTGIMGPPIDKLKGPRAYNSGRNQNRELSRDATASKSRIVKRHRKKMLPKEGKCRCLVILHPTEADKILWSKNTNEDAGFFGLQSWLGVFKEKMLMVQTAEPMLGYGRWSCLGKPIAVLDEFFN